MGSITYREAETHILASYFQRLPEDFGPFYIGLGSGGAPKDERTTLADIVPREITGFGYERQMVLRDESAQGWEIFAGDTVNSPSLLFRNNSFGCWESIDFAFLTLSPFGDAEPGLLIAAVDFKNSMRLVPGAQVRFNFRFGYNHANFTHQRIQCGHAAITATALILPTWWGPSASAVATVTAETDLFYAVDPPDILGEAFVGGAGGVEIQPYPAASTAAFATVTGDALIC